MNTDTLAQQAADLDWGLDAGMDTVADAVAWADQMLADPAVPYSDELFAISTGEKLSVAEMRSLLARLYPDDEKWLAFRRLLPRISDAIDKTARSAEWFFYFIQQQWYGDADDVPPLFRPAFDAAEQYFQEEDLDWYLVDSEELTRQQTAAAVRFSERLRQDYPVRS